MESGARSSTAALAAAGEGKIHSLSSFCPAASDLGGRRQILMIIAGHLGAGLRVDSGTQELRTLGARRGPGRRGGGVRGGRGYVLARTTLACGSLTSSVQTANLEGRHLVDKCTCITSCFKKRAADDPIGSKSLQKTHIVFFLIHFGQFFAKITSTYILTF